MDFENLHQILRSLYDEMMPLCSDMTDIAKGLAGLGALFYVALRVWQSLSRAEPIDVFPLLRPFAIGLAIMFFPTIVLGTLNSVMSPIVQGTHSMLETQTFDMNEYRVQKDKLEEEAMRRNHYQVNVYQHMINSHLFLLPLQPNFIHSMAEYSINRIRVVLAEQNKTNRWLAEQMGKSEITISRWVQNKSQPSLEQLLQVAKLLSISPKDLINDINDNEAKNV